MKTLLFVLAVAACGGSSKPKPNPPEPAPAAPAPATAAPAEKPAAPPADTGSIAAQAALAEQYDTGKKLYTDKKCASCHGEHGEGNSKNPKLIGDGALPEKAPARAKLRKSVAFVTAKDVLDFVKAKMPLKSPGSLSDAEAAAVTAWILSEDKAPIDKPLDAANAGAIKLR